MRERINNRIKYKTLFRFLLVAFFCGSVFQVPQTYAATSSQLNNQKSDLLQKIIIDGQQITAHKSQLPFIQQQIQQLNSQISSVKNSIASTQSNINTTSSKIADLKVKIDEQQAKYDQQKKSLSDLVVDWYMKGGDPGLTMTLLGNDSLSGIITMGQYYISIQEQIQTTIQRVNELKKQLADQKTAQEQQLNSLNSLKIDQVAQQKSLQYSQNTKNQMYTNTQRTISSLQQDQSENQIKLAQIQKDIASQRSQGGYGTDIISLGNQSWYYTQNGNYNTLGRSPFTIDAYGCLITSIAMVATYYERTVTPDMIANSASNFDKEGNLMLNSPPEASNIVVSGSSGIDWSEVDGQIRDGHPVIIGIQFPSIARRNSDGSNHYIVIYGLSGNKYLMQDPIGSTGYRLDWAVSMKIIRKL